MAMAMAAGGGRGQIVGGGDGFGLAFKADALWVGTRTDESNGPGGRLNGTSAAISRLRTALESSQPGQPQRSLPGVLPAGAPAVFVLPAAATHTYAALNLHPVTPPWWS